MYKLLNIQLGSEQAPKIQLGNVVIPETFNIWPQKLIINVTK